MLRVLAPSSPNLILLADLKDEMGISDSGKAIQRMVTRASVAIANAIGRPLHRQKYRESIKGWGTGGVFITATPIAGTPTDAVWMEDPYVDFDANANGLSEISNLYVADAAIGMLSTVPVIRSTARIQPGIDYDPVVGTEEKLIRLDYWGGWFPPGSTYKASTISFAASDQSINDSADGFTAALQPGDVITVTGSTDNNSMFTVVSVTASKIVVQGGTAIEDEAAGASVTLDYRNLPGDLEDAVMQYAKFLYKSRNRDVSLRSQRTQDLEVWYNREQDKLTRFPGPIDYVVQSYRRVIG